MKISNILDKIDEYQLFVPAFQREYVWKRDDAKLLLDSLIKEYPTGTMLTWETNKPPELKGSHKYDQKQGAVRILLDGQQLITTLYLLIRGTIPGYYTEAEISNDTRGLYVNVETGELEYFSKQKMETNPCWQNITDIFQKKVRVRDIFRQLEKLGQIVDRGREDCIEEGVRAVEKILEPVRRLNESLESFVNQGRRPDFFGGRRCGRARIAGVTSGAGCAIRATLPTRNGRWSSRSFRRPSAAATGGR